MCGGAMSMDVWPSYYGRMSMAAAPVIAEINDKQTWSFKFSTKHHPPPTTHLPTHNGHEIYVWDQKVP